MDKLEMKLFAELSALTEKIADHEFLAEQDRVARAKVMHELETRRFSLREIGEAAGGMTHGGVRQTMTVHGPGSERAKKAVAEKRRYLAAKKAQPDRQG